MQMQETQPTFLVPEENEIFAKRAQPRWCVSELL
jgi:hypothetical protein